MMSATNLGHDIEKDFRTQDVRISQNITFDTLMLAEATLKGLTCSGFQKPSPIQLHSIPLGKCGFDLLLEAKSGTGKTAVFSIIALEKLDLKNGLQTVILAPTREIAAQICDVIKQIGSNYAGLKVEVVMGGLPLQEDIAKFKKKNVHILVGSPGRVRHLVHDKHINISHVRLLVLDEADKLMEKSFQADINYIFSVLPKQKQVIMSSATYPETARAFIENYVQSAQHVCPETNSVLLGVEQKSTTVKFNSNIVKQTQHRFEELLRILETKPFKQCLIFCNYQARVVELHKLLTKHKWPAEQLYGQQEQTDRLDALKTLQEYKCRILVSSDLAARGIDASNVDLVINFEPPYEWQTYLHRIGRAGRFGSYGTAVSILSEGKEEDKFKKILAVINSSVDMRNFWTDKSINHSESDIITNGNDEVSKSPVGSRAIDSKDKCNKLRNLLLATSESEVKHIDTFQSLCQSFKESCNTTNTIEPFSDLVSSFQSFCKENTNNEDVFGSVYEVNNTFKLWKAEIENICSSIYVKKRLDINENSVANVNNELKENFPVNIDLLTHHSIGSSHGELKSKNKVNNSKVTKKNHKADIENKSVINGYKDSDFIENEYNLDEAALLEAGLPIAFGKQSVHQKKNNNNIKPVKKVENHRSARKERNKYNNEITSDEEDYASQYLVKKTNKCPSLNSSEDYGYNTLSNQFKSQNNLTSNSSNAKYKCRNSTSVQTKYDYVDKFNQYENYCINNSNAAPSENYTYWYNQLKFTVKQIEYSVYLNEMVKLNFN